MYWDKMTIPIGLAVSPNLCHDSITPSRSDKSNNFTSVIHKSKLKINKNTSPKERNQNQQTPSENLGIIKHNQN